MAQRNINDIVPIQDLTWENTIEASRSDGDVEYTLIPPVDARPGAEGAFG